MKKNLTNELIKSQFKNNFDLANYAIEIARDHIRKQKGNSLAVILKEIKEKVAQLAEDKDNHPSK